jgi:hypothetical protein
MGTVITLCGTLFALKELSWPVVSYQSIHLAGVEQASAKFFLDWFSPHFPQIV